MENKLYKIKPLEWDEEDFYLESTTPFGVYKITMDGVIKLSFWNEDEGEQHIGVFPSSYNVKFEAQIHYNELLSSFLEEVDIPTDEEVEKEYKKKWEEKPTGTITHLSFVAGCKWMRDKLFKNK